MEVIQTAIPEVLLFKPRVFPDERGLFVETYNIKTLETKGFREVFVQDNQSISQKGTVRGLHFQLPPFAQGKLVRVSQGSIIDVAVDIRKSSPTFGQYVAQLLSAENFLQLWIPIGFAHGFIALEDNTCVNYKVTNFYSKESEGSVRWNDPQLNIDWGDVTPLLSVKDAEAPLLKDAPRLFD